MERLRMAFKKYYQAHQISKSINILELARLDGPTSDIRPLKCISNFIEPKGGWDNKVTSTTSSGEQCFYCMSQIKEMYSDYICDTTRILPPAPDNRQCQYCYWYCAKKYAASGSSMQLTKKFTKKANLK